MRQTNDKTSCWVIISFPHSSSLLRLTQNLALDWMKFNYTMVCWSDWFPEDWLIWEFWNFDQSKTLTSCWCWYPRLSWANCVNLDFKKSCLTIFFTQKSYLILTNVLEKSISCGIILLWRICRIWLRIVSVFVLPAFFPASLLLNILLQHIIIPHYIIMSKIMPASGIPALNSTELLGL